HLGVDVDGGGDAGDGGRVQQLAGGGHGHGEGGADHHSTVPAVRPQRQYRCNSRKATTGGTRANSEPITTRGWYSGKPSSTRSVKVERDVVEGDRGPGVVLGRGDADDLLGPGERLDVGAQQSGRRRTPARSATGADPRDREDPLPAG